MTLCRPVVHLKGLKREPGTGLRPLSDRMIIESGSLMSAPYYATLAWAAGGAARAFFVTEREARMRKNVRNRTAAPEPR